MRAMQKNPNDRYRSSAEMLMDINEFKRNPSIKFNYSYFVDQEPTKYVKAGSGSVKSQLNSEANSDGNEKSVNKTTAIMLGAIAGVIALVVLIAGILGIMNNRKIEVDNFLSLNYYTQIENNADFDDFEFELKFDTASTLEEGTVISQTPKASAKVKKGSKITLTIAKKDGVVVDQSIVGMLEADAKNYLISRGVVPIVIPEYSETDQPGVVIRTDPAVGTTVKIGGQVTIFVATDKKETVKVPALEGCSKEVAEQLLKATDLVLGTVTEVDSELEAGMVVSQSIEKDTDVPIGTKVDITISNGIPSESSVDIVVTLPASNTTGTLKIYINSELYYTSGELYLDGANKTYTLKGKGADNTYRVIIDDTVIQEGKIDFTKVPGVVTEIKNNDGSQILVSVVGLTKDEAVSKLNAAGFKNIKIIEVEDATAAGTVISQSPTADGTTKYPVNQEIVLTVSLGTELAAD